MARTDYPVAGDTFIVVVPLTPRGGGDTFQTTPTLAAGDFQVLEDGSFVNLDNTPTLVGDDFVRILVSATETQAVFDDGEPLVIVGRDAADEEWQDIFISYPVLGEPLASLDVAIEGDLDLQETLRVMLAVLAGKSSGGGSTTITFRDQADSKARVTATVDASGNRTAVTVDGS